MEWADRDGLTSLSWACLKGQLTTATLLIKQGCDIEHADKSGRTCLDLAAYKGNPDVVSPIFCPILIKFIYSEKATKILRNHHLFFDW